MHRASCLAYGAILEGIIISPQRHKGHKEFNVYFGVGPEQPEDREQSHRGRKLVVGSRFRKPLLAFLSSDRISCLKNKIKYFIFAIFQP